MSKPIPMGFQEPLRGVLKKLSDWPEPESRTDGTRCPVSGSLVERCRVLSEKEMLTVDDLGELIGFMVNGSEADGGIIAAFQSFYYHCGGTARITIRSEPLVMNRHHPGAIDVG